MTEPKKGRKAATGPIKTPIYVRLTDAERRLARRLFHPISGDATICAAIIRERLEAEQGKGGRLVKSA